jgi:hypothetical protein
MDLTTKHTCGFAGKPLDYIYRELSPAATASFEKHLLECEVCADELADLSLPRLEVYEWHRDEFVPIPTPIFHLPVSTPAPRIRMLDGIRAFLAGPYGMTAGAVGAIVLAIVAGFLVHSRNGANVDAIASSEGPTRAPAVAKPEIPQETVTTEVKQGIVPDSVADSLRKQPIISRSSQAAYASRREAVARRGQYVRRAPLARPTIARRQSAEPKIPRLNTVEDEEDQSLRLADLFADAEPGN